MHHPHSHRFSGGQWPALATQGISELNRIQRWQGRRALSKSLELQPHPGQQASTGKTAIGLHPAEAEGRARIGHQHSRSSAATPGTPGCQGPVHPQPWRCLAEGHVGGDEAALWWQHRACRLRHHAHRRPAHQLIRRELLEPQNSSLGELAPSLERLMAPAHRPVPAAVADQQPMARARCAQIPSPITPGRWMPHSCLSPPKRVARPLTSAPSGALECQSPTVE